MTTQLASVDASVLAARGVMVPLLIFDLDGVRIGVDAMLVRETLWLPELTPIEEAPGWVIGLFSLRGRIVPVIDLNLRFNHAARTCQISDQVVVLELGQQLTGLIVSVVLDVVEISPDAVQPSFEFAVNTHHLITGEVRAGDDLVMLLDTRQLMHQLQASSPLPPELEEGLAGIREEQIFSAAHFCPQATPEEHAIFRARAISLMDTVAEADVTPLVVVELAGEYFGIELDAVQEFCDITQPAFIPCCPPHILGAISLRGNLYTLLDIRSGLNLPCTLQDFGHAVITRASHWQGGQDQSVGVAVDAVHEVIYLRQEEFKPAPLHEQAEVKAVAHYDGRLMGVLDLTALLARQVFLVNETA